MPRAPFVVFEGVDRSGKSTQTAQLANRLRKGGVPVTNIRFPDRTTAIGRVIDGYLRGQYPLEPTAVHLLFSANRWELNDHIERLLTGGTTVVCDRYAASGVAYSVGALGLDPSWCKMTDEGLVAPDLTIQLDVNAEAAESRTEPSGREVYEKVRVQSRVREAYRSLFAHMPSWHHLSTEGTIEEVADAVEELVRRESPPADAPLARLWWRPFQPGEVK